MSQNSAPRRYERRGAVGNAIGARTLDKHTNDDERRNREPVLDLAEVATLEDWEAADAALQVSRAATRSLALAEKRAVQPSGVAELSVSGRHEQIKRAFLATAQGLAIGVLETLPNAKAATVEPALVARAQRLFLEAGRILLQLEAGADVEADLLGIRLDAALRRLGGTDIESNQARGLRRTISEVSDHMLCGLEEAESAAIAASAGSKERKDAEAQVRAWESSIVASVDASSDDDVATLLRGLRDPGKILAAVKAAKKTNYIKKAQRSRDAMRDLLKALGLPAGGRSMKGRDKP